MGLLWAEHDPETARRSLNEAVYVLRREFGSEFIRNEGDDLVLTDQVACDVDQFRRALKAGHRAEAIELCKGPLLGTWAPPAVSEFEHSMEIERAALGREFLACLTGLATDAEAHQDWTAAAGWFGRLVDVDPYSIIGICGEAGAAARLGAPSRALRMLDMASERWVKEFGGEVPRAIGELRAHIRAGDLDQGLGTPLAPQTEKVLPSPPRSVPEEGPDDQRPAALRTQSTQKRRKTTLTAIVFGAVLVVGWSVSRPAKPRESGATMDRPRLAVLAFQDATGDSSLSFIAHGLHESVAGVLGSLTGLTLIAPEALPGLEEADISLDSIGRRFGYPLVVRGRLEASSDELRMAVRFLDSRTGEQMASLVVGASRAHVGTLRSELVTKAAAAIRRRLGESADASSLIAWEQLGAASPEAIELLWRAQLRARDVQLARTRARMSAEWRTRVRVLAKESDSLLALSEERNPLWAEPTIARARLAWERARLEAGPARILVGAEGLAHIERAIHMLTIDPARNQQAMGTPDSSGVLAVLRRSQLAAAYFWRGQLRLQSSMAVATFRSEAATTDAAERDLEQAVSLDSLHAPAWVALALPRWTRGDFQGAFEAAINAVRADPYGRILEEGSRWAARSAAAMGNRAETIRWCERGALETTPSYIFLDCRLQAFSLDAAGLGEPPDPTAVWALVDTIEHLEGGAEVVPLGRPYSPVYRRLIAAAVSAAAGDRSRAIQEIERANARVAGNPDLQIDILYDRAFVYAVLGERARALKDLEDYGRARPDYAGTIRRVAKYQKLLP